MFSFFLVSQNMPFTIALVIMLLIALMEGIGLFIGLGLSTLLESVFPEVELNVDAPDIDSSTTLSHILSWLRVGEVPFLIIIIVFLTAFGLSGLVIQQTLVSTGIGLISAWLAMILAFLTSLPLVRFFSGIFAKLMPQDETEAVSENSFIGKVATITLGQASIGSPAEAKLVDEYQQTHYIMVEPDNTEDHFTQGSQVLVVKKTANLYKVIANTHSSLH